VVQCPQRGYTQGVSSGEAADQNRQHRELTEGSDGDAARRRAHAYWQCTRA
jgi:hypothetical protein